jgi:SAM-dependent methyltransferase
MDWFKHWFGTRYYTVLYGHRDDADAGEWVKAILERWQLPRGAAVLDLACGRGRHARHFVEHGMHVLGVDISERSISEARVLVPDAKFKVADMRFPVAVNTYDGIVCLFTSLGYFESTADDQQVFDAVMTSLKPGGRFVLDFMNTESVLRGLVGEEVMERQGIRFHIERELVNDVLLKRITVSDGSEIHRFEERVQALRPQQLEEMALNAGLLIDARTGGSSCEPFDAEHSSRYVLWAHKPRA